MLWGRAALFYPMHISGCGLEAGRMVWDHEYAGSTPVTRTTISKYQPDKG